MADNTASPGLLQRTLALVCDIHPEETRATLTSFLLVFLLMGSYYVVRPVRDALASNWTDTQVSQLWTITFFTSTLAVFLYGWAISRIRFKQLVPSVYGLFAASFVFFGIAGHTVPDAERELLDKGFYLWVSLFALFHISVFWSFMSDTFSKSQATRLFGFIGAGASAGGLAGPLIASLLVADLGTDAMLLITAAMAALTVPLVYRLQHLKVTDLHNENVALDTANVAIGGNPLAGFAVLLSSRYLLAICGFLFLFSSIGSFFYFEMKNLLAVYELERRSQILANIDLAVNTLTILVGIFATGRITSRLGMPFTLASIPVVAGAGLLFLAFAPLVSVIIAVQIIRRIGDYAVSRPAREMLFTTVDRETRFKAKPVIDIVIYRGGDSLNAWAFTLLSTKLGLGVGGMALVGTGIAALWTLIAVYLGRQFNAMTSTDAVQQDVSAAVAQAK
jgi:ATP:ADP antiporter, AAA family